MKIIVGIIFYSLVSCEFNHTCAKWETLVFIIPLPLKVSFRHLKQVTVTVKMLQTRGNTWISNDLELESRLAHLCLSYDVLVHLLWVLDLWKTVKYRNVYAFPDRGDEFSCSIHTEILIWPNKKSSFFFFTEVWSQNLLPLVYTIMGASDWGEHLWSPLKHAGWIPQESLRDIVSGH